MPAPYLTAAAAIARDPRLARWSTDLAAIDRELLALVEIVERYRGEVWDADHLGEVPSFLVDAACEYAVCVLTSRASGASRNTLAEATETGTTRYSTPDWHAGRPTGYLEVDRLLNTSEWLGIA